jgi:hypothetical protein
MKEIAKFLETIIFFPKKSWYNPEMIRDIPFFPKCLDDEEASFVKEWPSISWLRLAWISMPLGVNKFSDYDLQTFSKNKPLRTLAPLQWSYVKNCG